MSERPPAPPELLARVTPIPTFRDHPATRGHDITGVDPQGAPMQVPVVEAEMPVLLLFLGSRCDGCHDFWTGRSALRQALAQGVRVVVVTRGPETEVAASVAALAQADAGMDDVVMSTEAFGHYAVAGPPFFALAVGAEVRTEGVAWGLDAMAETVRLALPELGR